MLTLNPNDNQGVRYMLLDWLLADGGATAAAALHKRYVEDASAMWQYAAALLAFQRKGDGAEARAALAEAVAGNPHVPALLLGRTRLPAAMPEYYSPGDESEAVVCVEGAAPAWKATPGALDWLASQLPGDAPAPRRPRKPRAGGGE